MCSVPLIWWFAQLMHQAATRSARPPVIIVHHRCVALRLPCGACDCVGQVDAHLFGGPTEATLAHRVGNRWWVLHRKS